MQGTEALVWDSGHNVRRLANLLNRMGANIPAGTTLTTAVIVSADGSTMVGQYLHSQFNFGNWMAPIVK